jgi:hypothetical protein
MPLFDGLSALPLKLLNVQECFCYLTDEGLRVISNLTSLTTLNLGAMQAHNGYRITRIVKVNITDIVGFEWV